MEMLGFPLVVPLDVARVLRFEVFPGKLVMVDSFSITSCEMSPLAVPHTVSEKNRSVHDVSKTRIVAILLHPKNKTSIYHRAKWLERRQTRIELFEFWV